MSEHGYSIRVDRISPERRALCSIITRQWSHRHGSEGKRKMLRAAIRMVRAC